MQFTYISVLFISAVENLLEDPTCLQYPQFVNHLERVYFPRKEEWSICARTHLPTHGANKSNYVETIFKVTKDQQFNRTKVKH